MPNTLEQNTVVEALAGLLAGKAAKGKQPVRVVHHRHLTPPSSGRATAGFAHRVPPLMSNVRAQ